MGVYDLSGDGGVVKTIIREANVYAPWPTKDMRLVDVHYVEYLADTREILNSTREGYNRYVSFEIGTDPLFRGWEIALPTMKVGEIAKLTCKPEYAYGSAGFLPKVPRNATIIFEMELLACRPQIYATSNVIARAGIISELEKRNSLAEVQDSYKQFMDRMEKAEKRKREAEVVGVVYDLTGDRGVLKKLISKAEANAIGPTNMSVVDVWYNGFIFELETGEIYNFTREDGAILTFKVGSDVVMPGWDIALKKMKVGDIATVTCKPGYAFGKVGCPPEIPPNLTVTSTLKLVKCEPWKWPAKPLNVKELREFKMLAVSMAAAEAAAECREEEEDEDCDVAEAKKAAAAAKREAKKAKAAAAVSAWDDVKAAADAAIKYYDIAAAAAAAARVKAKSNGIKKKIKGEGKRRTKHKKGEGERKSRLSQC